MLNELNTLSEPRTQELLGHIRVMKRELRGPNLKQLFDVDEVNQLLEVNSRVNELALDELKIPEVKQSNIRDHAVRELSILVSQPSDNDCTGDIMDEYEARVHEGVMDLLEVFIAQGHSGMSASWTLAIFEKLARFEALSPLTDNLADWNEVGQNQWQSKRQSSCFSPDGGKTYYDIHEELPWWKNLLKKVVPYKLRMKLPEVWRLRLMYKLKKTEQATVMRNV